MRPIGKDGTYVYWLWGPSLPAEPVVISCQKTNIDTIQFALQNTHHSKDPLKSFSLFFTPLTVSPLPLAAVKRGQAKDSVLSNAGLLLWFGDGWQQASGLLSVGVEERLHLLLGQLHVAQLLKGLPLLIWQGVAHCGTRDRRFRFHDDQDSYFNCLLCLQLLVSEVELRSKGYY